MEADPIPKIFRPFSNVLQDQSIDIQTSGAEQSNNISCSVVPRTVDFPILPFGTNGSRTVRNCSRGDFRANLMSL